MTRKSSTRRLGWLFALAAAFGAGHLVASPLAHVLTHALQGQHTHLPNGQVVYHSEAPSPSRSNDRSNEHRHGPGAHDHDPDEDGRSGTSAGSAPEPVPPPDAPASSDTDREAHPEHAPGETGERSSTGHTGDSSSHFTLLAFAAAPFVHVAELTTVVSAPPAAVARPAPGFELDPATAPRAPPRVG